MAKRLMIAVVGAGIGALAGLLIDFLGAGTPAVIAGAAAGAVIPQFVLGAPGSDYLPRNFANPVLAAGPPPSRVDSGGISECRSARPAVRKWKEVSVPSVELESAPRRPGPAHPVQPAAGRLHGR